MGVMDGAGLACPPAEPWMRMPPRMPTGCWAIPPGPRSWNYCCKAHDLKSSPTPGWPSPEPPEPATTPLGAPSGCRKARSCHSITSPLASGRIWPSKADGLPRNGWIQPARWPRPVWVNRWPKARFYAATRPNHGSACRLEWPAGWPHTRNNATTLARHTSKCGADHNGNGSPIRNAIDFSTKNGRWPLKATG